MLKDKDSFDYDNELSAMSMLSSNDARRKSAESDSIKASRKNKVFQHIKKEMEIRAKFKPVSNPAEQVWRVNVFLKLNPIHLRYIL